MYLQIPGIVSVGWARSIQVVMSFLHHSCKPCQLTAHLPPHCAGEINDGTFFNHSFFALEKSASNGKKKTSFMGKRNFTFRYPSLTIAIIKSSSQGFLKARRAISHCATFPKACSGIRHCHAANPCFCIISCAAFRVSLVCRGRFHLVSTMVYHITD